MSSCIQILLIALPLLATISFLLESWKTSRKYRHLPWIGMTPHTWWKLDYVRVKNFINIKHDFTSIADKYWAKGQACFIPMLMGDLLIVPPTDLEWLLDLPDDKLDIHSQLIEVTQATHTIMSRYGLDNPTHLKTISRDLTRRLSDLTQDIIDELALSIDQEWGTDTVNWNEVNPFDTLIRVIARTSNRVFVGPSLCRNPDFINHAISFASLVIPLSWILRLIPESIRSIFSPLITFKARYHKRQLRKVLKPEIEARLKAATLPASEKQSITSPPPNDFLQWTITNALLSPLPRETEVTILIERFLLANFVAIHTSTITFVNALYDLISPPSSQHTISSLRIEIESFIPPHTTPSKQTLSDLTQIDSALKESTRIGQLSAFGFVRMVVDPAGTTTPVSNTFLPPGTSIGIPIHMIHRDSTIYPDPNTYNPVRFADLRSSDIVISPPSKPPNSPSPPHPYTSTPSATAATPAPAASSPRMN